MSNFNCEICGAACTDSPGGYVSGCEHWPHDKPARQHISARLDSDLIAAIKERAEAEHRSTNNMIECLLFEAMAEK